MFSVQLLIAVYIETYSKAARVSLRTHLARASPHSKQTIAGSRKQEHSGLAIFPYSQVGTGTVMLQAHVMRSHGAL